MVCLRNICINTLHKGDNDGDDDDDNNNIIIIIIIIIIMAFMKGIYNYILETNLVSKVCSVTAIL